MTAGNTIQVEVVYALAKRQALVAVEVPAGSTAEEAVEKSAIAEEFPKLELSTCTMGIWGHLVERNHLLQDGDRIEIYRPLLIDPREARRQLAAEGKSMGHQHSDAGEAKDPV